MEYKDNQIILSAQESDDIDCDTFPDTQLDEVIEDVELLVGLRAARLAGQNFSVSGTSEPHSETTQFISPRLNRTASILHQLYGVQLERDICDGSLRQSE